VPNRTDRDSGLISQAIFTSAVTDRLGGYHVVAATAKIPADDLRALSTWCPSHDGMLASRPGATSVSFHPLPSGAFCVARTETAGAEYSDRGGQRLYTHCLLVPPAVLTRFSNNPLALLRAAVARGVFDQTGTPPDELPTVRLLGRANPVDATAVTRLGRLFEPERLAALLSLALTAPAVGLPLRHADRIVAGLINCMPLESRPTCSLATGLRFSPRRPFRWLAVDDDPVTQRHLAHDFDVVIVDPESPSERLSAAPGHDWADFAADCINRGRISALRAEIDQSTPPLALS
jgi:hypothetical protein